jgi:hypothetical protein
MKIRSERSTFIVIVAFYINYRIILLWSRKKHVKTKKRLTSYKGVLHWCFFLFLCSIKTLGDKELNTFVCVDAYILNFLSNLGRGNKLHGYVCRVV